MDLQFYIICYFKFKIYCVDSEPHIITQFCSLFTLLIWYYIIESIKDTQRIPLSSEFRVCNETSWYHLEWVQVRPIVNCVLPSSIRGLTETWWGHVDLEFRWGWSMSFTRTCPPDREGSVNNNFREDSLFLNNKCRLFISSSCYTSMHKKASIITRLARL